MKTKKPIYVETPKKSLYDEALDAYARAQAEQNRADIYYISMMSGIDIDPQEEGQNEQNV